MISIKIICIILILAITLISGAYPFAKKIITQHKPAFPVAESLAAGVFLGAGLIHMLGDAAQEFYALNYAYPIAFALCGGTFLFFLLLEHIGRELYHHAKSFNQFAILATIMLSIHSLLTGVALGVSDNFSITIVLLLAILAHKWAASFALAIQINKADFSLRTGIILFIAFAAMLPIGVILGDTIQHGLIKQPWVEPVFSSLAAGTFLYLGTLHGLERAVLIKQCCNLKGFSFVIVGFLIMATVAIWA